MRNSICLDVTCVFHRLPDFAVVKHRYIWSLSLLFLKIRTQLFPPTMSGYICKWVMNRVWLGSCACKLGNDFCLVKEKDGRHRSWLHTVNKNLCVCVCVCLFRRGGVGEGGSRFHQEKWGNWDPSWSPCLPGGEEIPTGLRALRNGCGHL